MKADPCHRIKTRTKTGNAPSTINFAVNTLIPLIFHFKCTSLKKYGTGLNLQARKLWRKVKFYDIPINSSNTMFSG